MLRLRHRWSEVWGLGFGNRAWKCARWLKLIGVLQSCCRAVSFVLVLHGCVRVREVFFGVNFFPVFRFLVFEFLYLLDVQDKDW